jgi:endonuclease/exonuclease/phosphatase family metal-dependent hydrolase
MGKVLTLPVRAVALAGLGTAAVAACATVGTPASATTAACRESTTHDVAWVHAPDGSDHFTLDAWCAGVGPVVLNPSDATSDLVADSLLVVTWNMHVGGGDLNAFVTDLRTGRVTGGGSVDHFVLLVQEAYRAGGAVPYLPAGARSAGRIEKEPPARSRADIVATAAALGLHVFYVPSMRNGADAADAPEDRGNAILSTLPLTEPAAIELPYEAQRRVVAAATINVMTTSGRSWPVRFASVHLDNRSRLARGIATLGPGRARQARALAEAMVDDTLAVVGADTNAWSIGPLEIAPRILHRSFADTPPHDGKPTHFAGGLGRRLDELFFRGSRATMTAPQRVDDRYGSDHHAVTAWIHLAPDS